eukprot:9264284-Karenia_brevis.AAC.1
MGLGEVTLGDPRLRRCGWSWIINSSNGDMGNTHVVCYGEHGSMEGRQTVPRSKMTAVMALLAVEQYGQGGNCAHYLIRQQNCCKWLWQRQSPYTQGDAGH